MNYDPFSKCHPAVNFLFFLGAIGCGVVILHPVYLAVSIVAGGVYHLLLQGSKGLKTFLGLLPLFVFLTVINPLFNTQGAHILFHLFGRPYTLEALYYGGAVAAMFVTMLLWFGCYNQVLTGDKFTALFGNLIPALSLILVMVFRMVPLFIGKAKQIIGARKSIGLGAHESATMKQKLSDGMAVLGTLTAWVLEGSVVTGDSMRARGYGTAKRGSFMLYRMTCRDWALLAAMVILLGLTLFAAFLGQTNALFTPRLSIAPLSWGIVPYGVYLLIPTLLHIKEAFQWHISQSKI